MLSWWNHVAPKGALLRVIVVTSGDRLVGVAPFFAEPALFGFRRYRVLGAGTSGRLNLLARPGLEEEVGAQFALALSRSRPRVQAVLFEGIPSESPWPELLRANWPTSKHPSLATEFSLPAPVLTLKGLTFDQWFAGKSSHFRAQMRRRLRQLEKAGASFHLTTDGDSAQHALHSFTQLHRQRWDAKGGSAVVKTGVEEMLFDIAHALEGHDQRFRLWSLDADDKPVASMIFVGAGDELTLWLGGFADDWARYAPSVLTLFVAIRDAFSRGYVLVGLGPGGQAWKYRFADTEQYVDWLTFIPRRRDVPLARLQLAPLKIRIRVAKKLPEHLKRRIWHLRSLLRRARKPI